MKKLTLDRGVPIISARLSSVISGINLSDSSFFAKLRHQQQYPRQTLFAGVEELVDKVGLDAHAASKKKLMNIS